MKSQAVMSRGSATSAAFGAAAAVAGLGALTFALFPFALPFAILLGVALVPLAPLLVLAALAGVLLRRAGR